MSLHPGQEVEVVVEKPAAGGRMLARHEGRVLLVHGGIPGERIAVRIDRVERQLAFGTLEAIVDASPDRRVASGDPQCGGCVYAHIAYPRQLELKAALVGDAFERLGRLPQASPVPVAASPERAYRMRARFHVEGERVGFYREASHEVCDARQTGQLRDDAVTAVEQTVQALTNAGCRVSSAILAENVPADQRVLDVALTSAAAPADAALQAAMVAGGLTGCIARASGGGMATAGSAVVFDPLVTLTAGRAGSGTLQRHAQSFFQANRFLVPRLVGTVLDAVIPESKAIDLYAGVGLFAIALAASGHAGVTAVEGDRSSSRDLQANAAAATVRLRVVRSSVEEFLRQARRESNVTIIVDPPRTGISRAAMQSVVALGGRRVVYVSCDPATMARDARRLVDGGYRLVSLQGFDLFPNTPHVEAVGIFDR